MIPEYLTRIHQIQVSKSTFLCKGTFRAEETGPVGSRGIIRYPAKVRLQKQMKPKIHMSAIPESSGDYIRPSARCFGIWDNFVDAVEISHCKEDGEHFV